jgi:hypothetical protein
VQSTQDVQHEQYKGVQHEQYEAVQQDYIPAYLILHEYINTYYCPVPFMCPLFPLSTLVLIHSDYKE